jgi:hypothetical protein
VVTRPKSPLSSISHGPDRSQKLPSDDLRLPPPSSIGLGFDLNQVAQQAEFCPTAPPENPNG